jgi:hypothetical protein
MITKLMIVLLKDKLKEVLPTASCFLHHHRSKGFPSIIIEDVTVIEHHYLVKPITIITIQIFDLSTMAGVKMVGFFPTLRKKWRRHSITIAGVE